MRQTLQRSLVILVVGAAGGLVINVLSPGRIAWITPPKPVLATADEISLAEAEVLWRSGSGFFLDARAPLDYAAGHIANALSLPAEAFARHYPAIAPMLARDSMIVVYCDGPRCELSHELLGRLRELGYAKTRVLVNAWTIWRQAKLPTTSGEQP